MTNRPLIKVCGMRDPSNIREIIDCRPDIMGLIFHPPSPRYVANPASLQFLKDMTDRPVLAGVFVNASHDFIHAITRTLPISILQLHGRESPDACGFWKKEGFTVIKAFGLDAAFNFEKTDSYSAACDYLLFDTPTVNHGGSGVRFDWDLLNAYQGKTPFLLSGGISPETASFPDHPALAGFDINSKFEQAPGLKNPALVASFIQKIRYE